MADVKEDVNGLFAPPSSNGLPADVMGELESILRLYSISPQEMFYKWESYSLKMGSEETKLDLDTVRTFKKDIQESLEKVNRGKHHTRGSERKSAVAASPRTNGNVYGMLGELTPNALPRPRIDVKGSGSKRRGDLHFPLPSKESRPDAKRVKSAQKPNNSAINSVQIVPFAERENPGQLLQTYNDHLPQAEAPIAPFSEARIKAVSNTDIKKFSYKLMAMKLSESSEVLDERIDEFMEIVQKHNNLPDQDFGNAAAQSTNEIVAVGRIASDTPEGKLNAASLVLEMSRRTGAGRRIPLKLDALEQYQFFPGQIVALRGTNASGEYFTVKEILPAPFLPSPVSSIQTLGSINERLEVSEESVSSQPLNIHFASGPYTADDNLDFEPLQALCSKAADDMVDAMVLTGPFLDIEHPLLATGDFDLPDVKDIDHDATMSTLFRLWISAPLQTLCAAVSSITVILVPSVRDAISKHVSWPQEQLPKAILGLPKQVKMVPNPCMISLNETVVGISSQDILNELRREQLSMGVNGQDLLRGLPRHLIEQRHFFPLFPPVAREHLPKADGMVATGACLDVGYLKLAEWPHVRPDVLLIPSILTPFVAVIEGVVVVNPGTLSKRKAAGTYTQMSLQPRIIKEEERIHAQLYHKVYERARIDVIKI